MTVDMLAATFFWPEGMLLGAQGLSAHHAPSAHQGLTPDDTAADGLSGAEEAGTADGFWATVARNLWRPAVGPSTGVVG